METWWIRGARDLRDFIGITDILVILIMLSLIRRNPPYLTHHQWRIVGQALALLIMAVLLPGLVTFFGR